MIDFDIERYQPGESLYLWWLGNPQAPHLIGELRLVRRLKGVSLTYAAEWLRSGFPLSEDLPLVEEELFPKQKETAAAAIGQRPPGHGRQDHAEYERPLARPRGVRIAPKGVSMAKFAANLSMLYTEHGFLDRFQAAAEDGFSAVEFLFPYAWPAVELAARLRGAGLSQALFNAPPGREDAGERGLACLPGREAEFRDGLARALEYADALACPRIHVMAGLAPADADPARLRETYVRNLAWAAEAASKAGRDVLIEPINTRDIPRYFLNRQADAHAVVDEIGASNLKVQMDLYHCQIVEGDLETRIWQYIPTGRVGHIQIAGVPARHEPDVGEVNFPYLFGVLDDVGYDGWIGCEYRPAAATRAGLDWFRTLQTGDRKAPTQAR
jgi:hydroxypyruvate isomerase